MKFATLAIFLGVISAKQFDEELINELKIEVTRAGQRAIEKEANDVGMTLKKIENSRPVRNLEASFKRFSATKEVQQLEQLDKKFLASPEGKRLMKEWRDVGQELKAHLKKTHSLIKTKNGLFHYENKHIDDLSDELDDVADQYKALDGSKWDKAFEVAFKKATSTKQAQSLDRRAGALAKSAEGVALHKEMVDLQKAIKKNLKISDVDSSDDDEDLDDIESMIKISVSKAGEKEISKELDDVEDTWKSIQGSQVVQNTGASLKKWSRTQQVKDLEFLNGKFLKSAQGKNMAKEIQDVFQQLDKAIDHKGNGLTIDNDDLEDVDDEVNDVVDQFESFKKSKWSKMYQGTLQRAFTNNEAKSVERRLQAFKASSEGKRLEKEMRDLDASLKKNVKITDLPKNFSEEDDLFLF